MKSDNQLIFFCEKVLVTYERHIIKRGARRAKVEKFEDTGWLTWIATSYTDEPSEYISPQQFHRITGKQLTDHKNIKVKTKDKVTLLGKTVQTK